MVPNIVNFGSPPRVALPLLTAESRPINRPGSEPIVRIVSLLEARELQEEGFVVTPYRSPIPGTNPAQQIPGNPFPGIPTDVNVIPLGFVQVTISRPTATLPTPLAIFSDRPFNDP